MYSTTTLKEPSKPSVASSQGTASFQTSTVNLVKNCVGAGVFSLNARVTSISSDSAVLLPTAALIVTMGIWAAYNYNIIGKTCQITKSNSYGEAWRRTVSESSGWIIQAVVIVAPIVTCLANTIVLTDILTLIMKTFGLPFWLHSQRNLVIGILGTFILYPLCILQDLSAFKSVSAVGILGHLTAMGAFAFRLMDKSYLPTGIYHSTSILAKQSGAILSQSVTTASNAIASTGAAAAAAASSGNTAKWFILASILSYCFQSHYNAPRYYSELEGKSEDNNKFTKFALLSYMIISSIYIGTIYFAMTLFGTASHSFALNNFSTRDPLALIARTAFGTSVLASFPLIFLAMRDWFIKQTSSVFPSISNRKSIAAILLIFICSLTTVFKDIGIVASISGGVLGTSMMFVFPPVMYIRALQLEAKKQDRKLHKSETGIIILNTVLMLCGASLGFLGTANSLLNLRR